MKEMLIILGVTAAGAVIGLSLRDPGPPPDIATTLETPADKSPTPGNPASRSRPQTPGVQRTDDVTFSDGSRQVTFYNTDGSRGMRINYGPERAGTGPQGGYIPPSYNTATTGPGYAGGAAAGATRAATRC